MTEFRKERFWGKAWKGQATDDHPHRCKARARRTGERCRRFALIGATKCHKHGGRREREADAKVRIDHLPRFYRSRLSKTLSEAVEQSLALAPHEQLNLFEELAVVRQVTGDAVELWSCAKQAVVDQPNNPQLQELLAATEIQLREAIGYTREIAEGAARIYAMCKDKLTPHNLQATVNQMVRIMHEVCGTEHQDLAEKFESAVATQVRVMEVAQGTDSTPDQVVEEMDDTIPLCSEDEHGEEEE